MVSVTSPPLIRSRAAFRRAPILIGCHVGGPLLGSLQGDSPYRGEPQQPAHALGQPRRAHRLHQDRPRLAAQGHIDQRRATLVKRRLDSRAISQPLGSSLLLSRAEAGADSVRDLGVEGALPVGGHLSLTMLLARIHLLILKGRVMEGSTASTRSAPERRRASRWAASRSQPGASIATHRGAYPALTAICSRCACRR